MGRNFSLALPEQRGDELRRGVTLIGPHRDDIRFAVGGADLSAYGSRGQQRLAVVALKLAEADLMLLETGERPVVLLDDVLSELDEHHRRMLTEATMKVGGQIFLTATDERAFESPELTHLPRGRVVSGRIEMVTTGHDEQD
jgi:DNA replication and repair protein RecF